MTERTADRCDAEFAGWKQTNTIGDSQKYETDEPHDERWTSFTSVRGWIGGSKVQNLIESKLY